MLEDCLLCTPAEGGFFKNLFTTDFVARARCVGDRAEIIWLHVVSDAVIAMAYFSIPVALAFFMRRRKDLAFRWLFGMFALFILFCGTTHVLGIVAYWHPMYRFDGVIKAATGAISIATAVALWPMIPHALRLPSPSELSRANDSLAGEISRRAEAQRLLEENQRLLETRVLERTSALEQAVRTQKAAEEHTLLRLAELEAVYASTPTGLCFLDTELAIQRINSMMLKLADRDSGANVVGKPFLTALPELAPHLHPMCMRALTTGETRTNIEVSAMMPGSANPRVWHVSVQPVFSGSSGVIGVSLAVHDVSERAILEESLRQSQKMDAIGQLASGIAHDINNQLTAIYGYLSIISSQVPDDSPLTEYLTALRLAAEQAGQTTKSLLTFARREPTVAAPTNFSEVITDTLHAFKGLYPARITVDSSGVDPNVWVLGDRGKLHQLVLNLMLNARDAIPASGRVAIGLRQAQGDPCSCVLTVADSGEGIPPEVINRVFEPFFSTKPRGQGTGLGLAIVSGIVKQHKGDAKVASIPGQGTTFTVTLPRIDPSEIPDKHKVDVVTRLAPMHGGVVLVAEDTRAVRDLMAMRLSAIGVQVVTANDGAKALELAMELGDRVRLLILDQDMPVMNGSETLRALREKGSRVPALMISGGSVDAISGDTRSIILAKPFRFEELLESISAALALADSPS